MKDKQVKRYGRIIAVKKGKFEEYKKYHSNVWAAHLKKISECNIRNFSIYHKDGLLFSYFEYVGDQFEKDMKELDQDPVTVEWMEIMKNLQEPLATAEKGEYWSLMEEVFHLD